MLFEIAEDSSLIPTKSFNYKENHIENYLCTQIGSLLEPEIFGDELLFLGRQISLGGKFFDMLALDRLGRCVVIELKRDKGYIATEMQALDYISILRSFQGESFLNFVTKDKPELRDSILAFVKGKDSLNKSSRIILVARGFKKSVFSLAKWIGEKGVAIQCIQYTPIQIDSKRYITFSTAYQHSSSDEYAEWLLREHQSLDRDVGFFWHILNDEAGTRKWWDHWRQNKFIALNYENVEDESCPGYLKMKEYKIGDTVYVWANGFGLVGIGRITGNYEYTPHSCTEFAGSYSHRRAVEWLVTVDRLEDAVKTQEVKRLGFGNPRQGKQQILQNVRNIEKLDLALRKNADSGVKRAS